MRRFVGIVLLIASAAGFAAVLLAYGRDDPNPPPLRRMTGLTGQRQLIDFQLDASGRPHAFSVELSAHCPRSHDRSTRWAPVDGRQVTFRWRANRLRTTERKSFRYGGGVTGSARTWLVARAVDGRIEGWLRAGWRFRRDGVEYATCDSGFVPFAAGRNSAARAV